MRCTPSALLVASALAAAACSDSTSPSGNAGDRVSLSFAVPATSAASTGATIGGVSAAVTASGPLVITKAQIVLRELELELASTAGCGDDSGSGSSDDDCAELEFEPFLVDLPVNGGIVSPISVDIPAGTYHELEMKIHMPELGDDPEDVAFITAHPELRGVSVRVEGTYNGEPFVFESDVTADMEMEFSPPLVVDASGMNVTVAVDLYGWFKAPDGSWIDPRTAGKSGVNEGEVEDNIQRSFHAFEDDDHDGGDDHGGDN